MAQEQQIKRNTAIAVLGLSTFSENSSVLPKSISKESVFDAIFHMEKLMEKLESLHEPKSAHSSVQEKKGRKANSKTNTKKELEEPQVMSEIEKMREQLRYKRLLKTKTKLKLNFNGKQSRLITVKEIEDTRDSLMSGIITQAIDHNELRLEWVDNEIMLWECRLQVSHFHVFQRAEEMQEQLHKWRIGTLDKGYLWMIAKLGEVTQEHSFHKFLWLFFWNKGALERAYPKEWKAIEKLSVVVQAPTELPRRSMWEWVEQHLCEDIVDINPSFLKMIENGALVPTSYYYQATAIHNHLLSTRSYLPLIVSKFHGSQLKSVYILEYMNNLVCLFRNNIDFLVASHSQLQTIQMYELQRFHSLSPTRITATPENVEVFKSVDSFLEHRTLIHSERISASITSSAFKDHTKYFIANASRESFFGQVITPVTNYSRQKNILIDTASPPNFTTNKVCKKVFSSRLQIRIKAMNHVNIGLKDINKPHEDCTRLHIVCPSFKFGELQYDCARVKFLKQLKKLPNSIVLAVEETCCQGEGRFIAFSCVLNGKYTDVHPCIQNILPTFHFKHTSRTESRHLFLRSSGIRIGSRCDTDSKALDSDKHCLDEQVELKNSTKLSLAQCHCINSDVLQDHQSPEDNVPEIVEDNQPIVPDKDEDDQPDVSENVKDNQPDIVEDDQPDVFEKVEDDQPDIVGDDQPNVFKNVEDDQPNIVEDDQPDVFEKVEDDQPNIVEDYRLDAFEEVEDYRLYVLKKVEDDQPDVLEKVEDDQPDMFEKVEDDQLDVLKKVEDDQPDVLEKVEDGQPDVLEKVEVDQPDVLEKVEDDQPSVPENIEENQYDSSDKYESRSDVTSAKDYQSSVYDKSENEDYHADLSGCSTPTLHSKKIYHSDKIHIIGNSEPEHQHKRKRKKKYVLKELPVSREKYRSRWWGFGDEDTVVKVIDDTASESSATFGDISDSECNPDPVKCRSRKSVKSSELKYIQEVLTAKRHLWRDELSSPSSTEDLFILICSSDDTSPYHVDYFTASDSS